MVNKSTMPKEKEQETAFINEFEMRRRGNYLITG